MNDNIIAIDFGNSFCKVSLRQGGGNSRTVLLTDELFSYDEANICIPSIIGRQRHGKRQFCYGTDALSQGDDIEIYRNWKPLFFDEGDQTSRDSLLGTLQRDNLDIEDLALGYFNWLRQQIEVICRVRHGIEDIRQIPVRITLPAFGNVAQATERLSELLGDSGWSLAQEQTAIHEPVANTIGVFSEGRNAVWRPGIPVGERIIEVTEEYEPHFGNMFGGTVFFEFLHEFALGQNDDQIHWVLIADLGGYTLDFAMLGIDLGDLRQMFNPERNYDGRPALARRSFSLGVMDLDELVYQSLPPVEKAAMERMFSEPDQLRLNSFHRLFYSNFRPFRVGQSTIGTPDSIEGIKSAMDSFIQKVVEKLEKFLDLHQYPKVDQLILTGGGANIPRVRKELMERVMPRHTLGARSEAEIPNYTNLSHELVRGATALGGTCVYFDF